MPAPPVAAEPLPVHRGPRVVHEPIDRAELDPDAVKIIERLTRFRHSAYLVGGCVRDLLLERKPKDFDVGTSATPRQIRRLFRNCRIIGRRFRLAHIYFQNGKIIEVATFRSLNDEEPAGASDGQDEDLLIRDDNQFGTMEQDALRRDFTINSLFYDIDRGTVLDHADGLGDLRRRVVRTIGDPTVRFKEDPIRLLRAIKFAARLDFDIEAETLRALRATRTELPKAATPRILEEINRFCRGGAARRSFELLRDHGIFEIIAPEVFERLDRDPRRFELFRILLDGFDRRVQSGGEITGGQIVVALVLPASVGEPGGAEEPASRDDADPGAEVDEVLRALGQRLRLPRKDQEYCRLVAATLRRMTPVRSLHRHTRRNLSRRSGLGDAMVVLESLAEVYGGECAEAARWWRESIGRGGVDEPARTQPAPPEGAEPEVRRPGRRRRRGRRRGGGARPAAAPVAVHDPGPAVRQAEEPRRPPVWDDDYFFAALPSVPQMERDEAEGDRYGTAVAEPVPIDPGDSGELGSAEEPGPPQSAAPRRRRPRRRRRGGSRGGGKQEPGPQD